MQRVDEGAARRWQSVRRPHSTVRACVIGHVDACCILPTGPGKMHKLEIPLYTRWNRRPRRWLKR